MEGYVEVHMGFDKEIEGVLIVSSNKHEWKHRAHMFSLLALKKECWLVVDEISHNFNKDRKEK